jgi:hypothetical protein
MDWSKSWIKKKELCGTNVKVENNPKCNSKFFLPNIFAVEFLLSEIRVYIVFTLALPLATTWHASSPLENLNFSVKYVQKTLAHFVQPAFLHKQSD